MQDGLEKIVRGSLNERLTFPLLFSGSGLNCGPEIFEAPYWKVWKHKVLRIIRLTPFYLALLFLALLFRIRKSSAYFCQNFHPLQFDLQKPFTNEYCDTLSH